MVERSRIIGAMGSAARYQIYPDPGQIAETAGVVSLQNRETGRFHIGVVAPGHPLSECVVLDIATFETEKLARAACRKIIGLAHSIARRERNAAAARQSASRQDQGD